MSVDVTLLPDTIPHSMRGEDLSRRREYKDRAEVAFQYAVHRSGALVIWRRPAGGLPEVECVLGPSSWEEVQGDLFQSLS